MWVLHWLYHWVNRKLRPHRYWTQAEIDEVKREAAELIERLGWDDDDDDTT